MTRDNTAAELTLIFRDVFDDDKLELTDKMTSDDIEDWDSITHLTLITEIEKRFRMKFKMREISGMKNVGELISIVCERTPL